MALRQAASVLTKGDCCSSGDHESWLTCCWDRGPRMTQVPSEEPTAPAAGARGDGGDSQTQREASPSPSLGQRLVMAGPRALGKSLPSSPSRLRLGVGLRLCPQPSQGIWKELPSLLSHPCSARWGKPPPHAGSGGGPGSLGVLPLMPRCPWLVMADGWRGKGGMEPRVGGAQSPKK